jgi:hypothetical protein
LFSWSGKFLLAVSTTVSLVSDRVLQLQPHFSVGLGKLLLALATTASLGFESRYP